MPFKKGESGNPGGRWRPGQSGNPGGRPKSRPYRESLERILKKIGDGSQEKALDELNAALYAKAMQGDVAAYKEMADRMEGKVPTPIGGTDELPALNGFGWIEPEQVDTDNAALEGDELANAESSKAVN